MIGRLTAQGMGAEEAERKRELFVRVERALPGFEWAWFVPGRVELLGKHTDYAGGRSLLCTVERGFCAVARGRSDATVRVTDAVSGNQQVASLNGPPSGAIGWGVYPATVARRLALDFGITRGVEIAFASDLPVAAGLSSSTVLCIAVYLALAEANALEALPAYGAAIADRYQLAGYLGALENGKRFGSFPGDAGVGTLGGQQDQTAILCSAPGELLQVRFDPVRFERWIPFPRGQQLAIAACGVAAEKTAGARASYNAAAEAVIEILGRWHAATGRADATLAAALGSSADARERLLALAAPDPVLAARLEQFITESEELVAAAGDALLRGDLAALGGVVDRSHAGARRGLRNQIPETNFLQESARAQGAAAASAFGAGFGGSVWAMIDAEHAGAFRQDWARYYRTMFPAHAASAEFFLSRAGPPALRL